MAFFLVFFYFIVKFRFGGGQYCYMSLPIISEDCSDCGVVAFVYNIAENVIERTAAFPWE